MADGVASRFNQVAYSAVHERHLDASAMMAGGTLLARPGKRPGPGLEVTVGGSPEAVTVQPGGGIVNGPSNGDGSYTFAIQAAVSKTLPARPGAGTSRVDLVVVRVYDADVPAFSTALREVNVEHIAGVAAASPSAPAIPMGALLIATLTVPASGSITIAPNQAYTAAAGGRLVVADAAARDAITPKWAGLEVYRLDTLAIEVWNGGAWVGAGAGHLLLNLASTGNATAPSTTPVTVPGIDGQAFTLSSARKVRIDVHAQTCTGASGGEFGRLTLAAPAGVTRRSQWNNPQAAANGEVSTGFYAAGTLAAGTHTINLNVLRVTGGTSVTVSAVALTVTDLGPA